MRWARAASVVAAMTAALAFGAGSQAQAASHNSGWVKTTNGSGAGYFDADYNGHPGAEKFTVCDKKAGDGRGIRINLLSSEGENSHGTWVDDPKADGRCVSKAYDEFTENVPVRVKVCEYKGAYPNGVEGRCRSVRAAA